MTLMICIFHNCSAIATEYVALIDYACLCELHREMLTEMRAVYKSLPANDGKKHRQLVGYLFRGIFDSGHEFASGIRRCYACAKYLWEFGDLVKIFNFNGNSYTPICGGCHSEYERLREVNAAEEINIKLYQGFEICEATGWGSEN
jgi:hypothetical protein